MRTIKRYLIDGTKVKVMMPKGAKVLCAGWCEGRPWVWALVDVTAENEERCFSILWENNTATEPTNVYVGSFYVPATTPLSPGHVLLAGSLIYYHVFTDKE